MHNVMHINEHFNFNCVQVTENMLFL